MRRTLLPLLMISLAAGAAALLHVSAAPSRESVLPLSRAAGDHAKGLDRAAGAAFPLAPERERELGARLAARVPEVPHELAPRWREFGQDAASSPLVTRQRGHYEFRVGFGHGVNAFALPGGLVYATPPLLERFRRDEDALLFVLAHEIGHVELGHCADAHRYREGKGPVGQAAGSVLAVSRMLAALQFSETQELEADAFAARLLESRRRDPRAGLRALRALGIPEDRRTKRPAGTVAVEALADYFSTHPGSWERLAALEREIAARERRR